MALHRGHRPTRTAGGLLLVVVVVVALLLLQSSTCDSLQLLPTQLRQKISNRLRKRDTLHLEQQPIRLSKAPRLPDVEHSRLSGVLPSFRQDAASALLKHAQYCWDHDLAGTKLSFGVTGSIDFIVDPSIVETIMSDKPTTAGQRHGIMFKSSLDRRGVGLLTGTGVLLSDGADHTRKRRLILPSFDAKSLASFVSTMERVSLEFAQATATTITSSNLVNVPELTSGVAMKIVGLCLFSTDVVGNAQIYQDISKCLDHVVYVSRHPFALPQWIPTKRNRQFKNSLKTLDDLIDGMIQSGRARDESNDEETTTTTTKDLLGMLLAARYENEDEGSATSSSSSSAALSDKELRDEIMTLFLAGHETSAIALSWTLWFLSDPQHHHWQDKIVEEYDNIIMKQQQSNDAGSGNIFSPQILQDPHAMKYTRAVLCEALRLRTPSYAFDREVQCDTTLTPKDDGTSAPIRVKKGDLLLISPLAMHLDPKYFDEPLVFNPNRFLTPKALKSSPDVWDGPYDRSNYLPFGAGRKRCIGYRFAQWEMLIIMSTIIKHHKVTRPKQYDNHDVSWTPEVTLRPDRSLELLFEPRREGEGAASPSSSETIVAEGQGGEEDMANINVATD